MDRKDLSGALGAIKNARRIYRDEAVQFVYENQELLPHLLDQVFETDNQLHIRAAWILELLAVKDIQLLEPYFMEIVKRADKVKNESSLRPVSKTCAYLIRSKSMNDPELRTIDRTTTDRLIELNFDWLINEHKVATQVHAMDSLVVLGTKEKWVHRELKLILQKNTATGTKGYQSHARKILKILADNED